MIGLGLGIGLGGCVADHGGRIGPVLTPPGGAVVASPFSPAGIRVIPLTHFERTDSDGLRVMLFFELLDQWGDTVKGAGTLEVRVRPAGERPAGDRPVGSRAGRLAEWEIDLSDLDRNAALYDPSTRAYRLALKELPEWLRTVATGEGAGAAIEVYFKTIGADGQALVLRDRFELRRSR